MVGSFLQRVLVVLHSTRKSRHVLLLSQMVHFEVELTTLHFLGGGFGAMVVAVVPC
jgi:hypothetical protein